MSLAPTEGFQLDFLRKLQRLFNEGQFVATYKFALLNAIADLAVATYFAARIRRLGMHSIWEAHRQVSPRNRQSPAATMSPVPKKGHHEGLKRP